MIKKKRLLNLFIIMMVGSLGQTSAPLGRTEDSWTQVANMPTPRAELAAAVVEGRIYTIGGYNYSYPPSKFQILATVEEYNPTTNIWTRRADMLTARYALAAAVVDGRIYTIGGVNESGDHVATVDEYNPVTDTWRSRADMPTPRQNLVAVAVDGRIYAIGGWNGWDENSCFATVEMYDPTTNMWTRRTDMPTARFGLTAAVVNGYIYILGGGFRKGVIDPPVELYDPSTDTWTTRHAPYPVSNSYGVVAATVAVGGRIYFLSEMGGYSNNQLMEYNPTTDTWQTLGVMPRIRAGHVAVMMDGWFYVFGGHSGKGNIGFPIAEVDRYDPPVFDTDGDGLSDVQELRSYATDPLKSDTDKDGVSDGVELKNDINPLFPDASGIADDAWSRWTPMPTPRGGLASVAVGGRLYAIGGQADSIFAIMEEYNPITDNWISRTPMPTPRSGFAVAVVRERIYAIGGADGNEISSMVVEEYDPAIDKWSSRADMPTPRTGLAAVTVDDQIYAIGGFNGTHFLTTVERYDPYRNLD